MTKPLKVVIDRAKWRSGGFGKYETGQEFVALRNDEGYMCCLGFALNQVCGVSMKALINMTTPADIAEKRKWKPKTLKIFADVDGDGAVINTDISEELMCHNDNEKITPKQREAKVKAGFKRAGIQCTFTGRYEKVSK